MTNDADDDGPLRIRVDRGRRPAQCDPIVYGVHVCDEVDPILQVFNIYIVL